ncbi:acyl-CoA carboxylase subunit epsilon [Streptomyces bambusae]|uniref:Acyl-CoA carboxylase subunit epsilon n=1 Tax=Streptomyces bambusae TaxID=1550616 RepID=A0ABS6Z1N1_9ACTN|nr:acyl-CoA carboxylase subunit epsilon [Streptomyces bambusae]
MEGPLAPTLFKIINGRPTPEELAAVAALVAALTARQEAGHAGYAGCGGGDDAEGRSARWQRPELLPPASWQAPRA